MGDTYNFYAVRKDKWDDIPIGVQKFIEDFFEAGRIIFGIECLVAVGSGYKAPYYEYVNSDDYDEEDEYLEGIQAGSVWDWLDGHPEIVFSYSWS